MNKKRFVYGETDLFEWVEDNGEIISTKECVNLLNEQQITIQSLKKENKKFRKRLRKCANNWKQEIVKRGKLEEENEELKQQLVDVTKSIDSLCNRVDKSNRSNEFKWGAIMGLRTLQRELKGDGV